MMMITLKITRTRKKMLPIKMIIMKIVIIVMKIMRKTMRKIMKKITALAAVGLVVVAAPV